MCQLNESQKSTVTGHINNRLEHSFIMFTLHNYSRKLAKKLNLNTLQVPNDEYLNHHLYFVVLSHTHMLSSKGASNL